MITGNEIGSEESFLFQIPQLHTRDTSLQPDSRKGPDSCSIQDPPEKSIYLRFLRLFATRIKQNPETATVFSQYQQLSGCSRPFPVRDIRVCRRKQMKAENFLEIITKTCNSSQSPYRHYDGRVGRPDIRSRSEPDTPSDRYPDCRKLKTSGSPGKGILNHMHLLRRCDFSEKRGDAS